MYWSFVLAKKKKSNILLGWRGITNSQVITDVRLWIRLLGASKETFQSWSYFMLPWQSSWRLHFLVDRATKNIANVFIIWGERVKRQSFYAWPLFSFKWIAIHSGEGGSGILWWMVYYNTSKDTRSLAIEFESNFKICEFHLAFHIYRFPPCFYCVDLSTLAVEFRFVKVDLKLLINVLCVNIGYLFVQFLSRSLLISLRYAVFFFHFLQRAPSFCVCVHTWLALYVGCSS